MSTVVLEDAVCIPDSVKDLDSFCRWVCSDGVSERGRFAFLNGEIWVDMSPEAFFSHNQVKGEFTVKLGALVRAEKLGRFCPDGMLLRNDEANLSTEPDGTYLSKKTLQTGRATVERMEEGYDVIRGTADMVLEVVSRSSQRKDPVVLRKLYWEAGIPEYWLVDARKEPLRFDILRYKPKGYVAVRKQDGWIKSAVFGKSFKLTVAPDEFGDPEYTLSVR